MFVLVSLALITGLVGMGLGGYSFYQNRTITRTMSNTGPSQVTNLKVNQDLWVGGNTLNLTDSMFNENLEVAGKTTSQKMIVTQDIQMIYPNTGEVVTFNQDQLLNLMNNFPYVIAGMGSGVSADWILDSQTNISQLPSAVVFGEGQIRFQEGTRSLFTSKTSSDGSNLSAYLALSSGVWNLSVEVAFEIPANLTNFGGHIWLVAFDSNISPPTTGTTSNSDIIDYMPLTSVGQQYHRFNIQQILPTGNTAAAGEVDRFIGLVMNVRYGTLPSDEIVKINQFNLSAVKLN